MRTEAFELLWESLRCVTGLRASRSYNDMNCALSAASRHGLFEPFVGHSMTDKVFVTATAGHAAENERRQAPLATSSEARTG